MEQHPECTICLHEVQCINEDGSVNERVIPEPEYGLLGGGIIFDYDVVDALWKEGGYPFQTSFFVRRDSIQKLVIGAPYFTNYFNGDRRIIRLALNEGQIYYFCQSMSCYRQFSADSYNEQYINLTSIGKEAHWVKKVKGELLYDEYTFGRFHELIIRYVSSTIVNAGLVDNSLTDGFLSDTNLKRKEILSYCFIK